VAAEKGEKSGGRRKANASTKARRKNEQCYSREGKCCLGRGQRRKREKKGTRGGMEKRIGDFEKKGRIERH